MRGRGEVEERLQTGFQVETKGTAFLYMWVPSVVCCPGYMPIYKGEIAHSHGLDLGFLGTVLLVSKFHR